MGRRTAMDRDRHRRGWHLRRVSRRIQKGLTLTLAVIVLLPLLPNLSGDGSTLYAQVEPDDEPLLGFWPRTLGRAMREALNAQSDDDGRDPDALLLGPPGDLDEGIEADGRIPKIDLPDDLDHPERWRYIPEGLIPPGNVLDRFLSTTFVTPIIFFEDDVGTGGGLQISDIDLFASRRQQAGTLRLSYTTEGQQQYKASWRRWYHQREMAAGGVIQEERSWIGLSGGFTRTLTRRFYGFGAESDDEDESSYSESLSEISVHHQLTFPHAGDDWVVSWGAGFERRNLGDGEVVGVPNTGDAFPVPFDEGDGLDSLWLRAGLRYDTRDSQHLPYAGGMVGIGVNYCPVQSRQQRGALIRLESSKIWPVPPLFHWGGDDAEEHPPIDTFAVALQVRDTTGNLPFWALPSLGGNFTLRGYPPDRFIDEASLHYSAEYRFWLFPRGFAVIGNSRIERLGAALFYEGGTVAESSRDLIDEDQKWSAGVGLRMTFERLALFRVDVGFSDEGSNLSVNFGLSF